MMDSNFLKHFPNTFSRWVMLFLFAGWTWAPIIRGELYDTEGPQFTQEPSRSNYFTNVQGGYLHCSAKGSPKPQIQWIGQQDGQSVLSYPGIREIFLNGTMFFPPFPVSFYRPDVHDQTYFCLATNSVGKIISREVHVRAVINQRFEVHVEDAYAVEGSDAILKCHIPDAVKDFVSVTSWIKDGSFNIFPGGGSRYFMTPSGELLLEEVTRNDSSSNYRCRTVNKLTSETMLSENSMKIRLQLSGGSSTKSKSDSPPSIKSQASKLKLKEGEVAVLLCLSEGWPPPTHWWYRSTGIGYGLEILRQTERVRIRKSALIIENLRIQDSGTYVLYANSSAGSDRLEIDVVVTVPLSVALIPSWLTVDIGRNAEFTCWTNSLEEQSTNKQISWRKDGVEIRPSLRVSMTGDKIRISNVLREDKGMYQCLVKTDSDMGQGTAELRLGDAAPQLVYRFIEQTLRPGPAVSLKCSASGVPTPRIAWELDGFPMVHSERVLIGQYQVLMSGDVVSHLNISSTRIEDGGEMKCVATNKLGISSHSARLNIYGPPFVRNMPATITAVGGKDFRIKCPVGGYPISSISWEKDGRALPINRRQIVSNDGSLTVKDVDRGEDSASWYQCIATNKQGATAKKGFQLNVVVPPKLVPFSLQATKEGGKIFATCVAEQGDPSPILKWMKDNLVLGVTSDITIHRIGGDSALVLQITQVTQSHAGNYSCLAENSAGKVIHTSELIVHVPPKIAPIQWYPAYNQGSRISAVCSVEQGDVEETNLTVGWLKDSVPIELMTTSNFIKVVHVDAFSAMLIIDRVDIVHQGNYTCKIKNSVEEVSKTVPLIVRVPPKWTLEPKDIQVIQGSPIIVACEASGFPTPSMSWKRQLGNRAENYRDIPVQSASASGSGSLTLQHQPGGSLSVISSSSEDTFSLANGTLVISSSRKSHEGLYLCEAFNGIGKSGLSKVIRLKVNVPIHVKEAQQNVSSRVGGKATLRCEMIGDVPILEFGWKRGISEINPDTDFRYHIRTLNTTEGIFTELTINNVGRADGARYSCSAANHHGRSSGSVFLLVQEPPDTPRNLHVLAKGSRFVRLGWTLMQDGNSPIIQFILKYKLESAGNGNDFHEIIVPGQSFSETVGKLKPSKTYLFFCVAENKIARSEPSEMLEIQTDGEVPEGRPKNVRVTAFSSSEIQVTWENLERDHWNGELLGYYLGYKKFREGEQYQFNTIERREGLQEYQIKGLHAFSSYEIVVQAYNTIGSGPFSEPLVASTLEDQPNSPPENVMASPLSSHSLQVSWHPLSKEQAHGLIKGYKVFLERTDFDLVDTVEPPLLKIATTENLIVSGLSKYKNYSIQVQAFTTAGDGPLSSPPAYCLTLEDLPGSPASIKSAVGSASSIIVSWLPPVDLNGVLTKYTVTLMPEAGKSKDAIKRKRQQVPPDVTKYQFDGLRVEDKYELKVTASTRVGEGPAAFTHRVLTNSVQPAITAFGMEFKILWKTDLRLPCETSMGNPTQWTRHNSESVGNTDRVSGGKDGSLLIRQAKRSDSGNYSCAIHDKGKVVESIMHKVVVQVPPLGPLLNAAVNSHSSLNLQWKLSDSGDAPIRGYVLNIKAADEWLERHLSRHLTSYELKGLECGTAYQMYLTAYNRAGQGRASDILNISTLGHLPSLSLAAPQFMVETKNQSWTKILLRDVWASNGCLIRKFQVLYRESETSYPTHWRTVDAELTGESQSVDLIGLKGGSSYHVQVIATNSAGSSKEELKIHIPSSHEAETEISNTIMNYSKNIPFYLDMKLLIPIVLSVVALLIATGGICLCFRKKAPVNYRSTDHLSIGTSSSSTYFKQNQRNAQQVYMTVKKSTPLKGVDVTDIEPIPLYADDIMPYATFELNETRRDCTSIPTLDRRRSSNQAQWNQNSVFQDNLRSNMKPKLPRTPMKQEDEEYDSYGSDTDTEPHPLAPSIHKANTNRLNSKFHDYDSHVRHGNAYELAPTAMLKGRQNEIHGVVSMDPYSFNDAFPTYDKGRKKNEKRSIRSPGNSHPQQMLYETSEFSGLDPPYEFKDTKNETQKKKTNRKSNSASTEYAIAV